MIMLPPLSGRCGVIRSTSCPVAGSTRVIAPVPSRSHADPAPDVRSPS
jgi:hypothetical protein